MENKTNTYQTQNLTARFKTLLVFLIFLILASVQAQFATGEQWRVFTTANSPLPSNTIGTIVIDTNNIKWIGTANGMVKIEGNNWQIYDTNNTPFLTNSIYPRDIDRFNNVWVTIPQYGIAKFNGFIWTVYDTTNSGLPSYGNVNLSIDGNNVKWICTPGITRFDDVNWTIYNSTNSGLPHNVVTTVTFENHIKWIGTFSLSGGMAKFNDTNWVIYNTSNSGIPSNTIRSINIDDWGNKWICTYGGGLAKFNSLSNIWNVFNPSNSGLPSYYPYSIIFRNGYCKFIGTGNGVAVFNDTTWQVFNTSNSPLPTNYIGDIKIDKLGNIWIATTAGLVVYNPSIIIGINKNEISGIKDFELLQNFPNPFNTSTKIKYKISKSSFVKIIIYDIIGKEFSKIINQSQQPGTYTINFNATMLSSGIYYYSLLINGELIDTKKFVLIK